MSFLAKLERVCATFIERAFAKSFPSDVEPAQIARKLVSTMEAQTRDTDGRHSAPGCYAVYVNPADFERLEEHREYLERTWAELLRDLAGTVGIVFEEGDARVAMAPRSSVPLGAIAVEVGDERAPSRSIACGWSKACPRMGYIQSGEKRELDGAKRAKSFWQTRAFRASTPSSRYAPASRSCATSDRRTEPL